MQLTKNTVLQVTGIILFVIGLLIMFKPCIGGFFICVGSLLMVPAIYRKISDITELKSHQLILIISITVICGFGIFLATISEPNNIDEIPEKTTVEEPASSVEQKENIIDVLDNINEESNVETNLRDIPSQPEIMEVHFIDVGQADATLIKLGDNTMLIDAGTDDKGTAIQYYLKKQNISHLDYLILTHPDSDHIGGADVIITKFDIDNILMSPFTKDNDYYKAVIKSLNYKGYDFAIPTPGMTFDCGDAKVTIISPYEAYSDPNNSSVCLILQYGDNRFLFTGDASEDAENDIVKSGMDISADVYKLGHHGSSSASTEPFLEKVKPTHVVISCLRDNEYGHPHQETLDRLKIYNPEIFRTDEQGTIIAYSDGKNITWNVSPSTTWKCGVQTQQEIPTIYDQLVSEQNNTQSEAEYTYVLNIKSKKFHLPDCTSVTDMKEKNKEYVTWTRDECISNGYKPCGNCLP